MESSEAQQSEKTDQKTVENDTDIFEDENANNQELTKEEIKAIKKKEKRKKEKAKKNEKINAVKNSKLELQEEINAFYAGKSVFEKDLDWCCTQIKMGLARNDPDKSQVKESLAVLEKLEDPDKPIMRKKQLMTVVFGEYKKVIEEMGFVEVYKFHLEIIEAERIADEHNKKLDEEADRISEQVKKKFEGDDVENK